MTISRFTLFIMLGLMFAPWAHAQQNDAVQSYAIHVIGVDSKPLPRARLWVIEDDGHFPVADIQGPSANVTATTDDDGRAIVQMPAKPVNIVATADGCAPLLQRGINLTAQQATEIQMLAGRSVSGTVVDEAGAPAPSMRVAAQIEKGSLDFVEGFTSVATTDVQGRFTLAHVADGNYVLQVKPVKESALSFLPVPVQVGASMSDVSIQALPGPVIKGKIISKVVPVAGKRVTANVRSPRTLRLETKTQEDGSFVLNGLPIGARGTLAFESPARQFYAIVSLTGPDQPGLIPYHNYFQLDGLPGGVHEGLEVQIVGEATIHGQISDVAGTPLPNAQVVVDQTNRLFPGNEAGQYTAQVPAGVDVTLRVEWSRRFVASSVENLRVEAGQTLEHDITAQVHSPTVHEGKFSGEVVDSNGKPVPAARVYVGNSTILPRDQPLPTAPTQQRRLPWNGGDITPATITCDALGEFGVDGIDAGKTDLWAYDDHAGSGWVRGIDTTKPGKLTIQLSAPPEKFTIAGTVTDPAGKPVDGTKVFLLSGDLGMPSILTQTTTDQAGKYSLSTSLPPRDYAKYCRLAVFDSRLGMIWRLLPEISIADMSLQFRPAARLKGRVVDFAGKPVKDARIFIYDARDTEWGQTIYWRNSIDIGPSTTTDADGMYELGPVPQGTYLSVAATHPDHALSEAWIENKTIANQPVQDLKMNDGILVEGTVRFAGTHQPVRGATVTVGENSDVRKAVSDDLGHYHLAGISQSLLALSQSMTVRAAAGEPPQWEGLFRYHGSLYERDSADGVDIEMDKSYSVREAEWRKQPGQPAQSASAVAVLEDLDPPESTAGKNHDLFTIYDNSGKVLSQIDDLNISASPFRHAIVSSPIDKSIWVAETAGGRLLKFSRDGKLLWQKPDVRPSTMAIDPKTGNAWVIAHGSGRNARDTLIVFGPDGQEAAQHPNLANREIIYSAHDDCFWTTGAQLTKFDRDGNILAQPKDRFLGGTYSIGVNDKDGSVWITQNALQLQRPGDTSKDALSIFESNGTPRKDVADIDYSLAVDSEHDAVWAVRRVEPAALVKLDLAGNIKRSLPLVAFGLSVEPDTGYVWVTSDAEIDRLDRDGNVVTTIKSAKNTWKWIAVIP